MGLSLDVRRDDVQGEKHNGHQTERSPGDRCHLLQDLPPLQENRIKERPTTLISLPFFSGCSREEEAEEREIRGTATGSEALPPLFRCFPGRYREGHAEGQVISGLIAVSVTKRTWSPARLWVKRKPFVRPRFCHVKTWSGTRRRAAMDTERASGEMLPVSGNAVRLVNRFDHR